MLVSIQGAVTSIFIRCRRLRSIQNLRVLPDPMQDLLDNADACVPESTQVCQTVSGALCRGLHYVEATVNTNEDSP